MKPNNPFLIAGYYNPEFFCDRKAETATILDALHNGRYALQLDDDILWLAKEDKIGKALQDLSLKTRERASKKE